MTSITRRSFLRTGTAISAAAMVLPRHVLGGTGYVPPSEKINIGYVGCGAQGMRHLIGAVSNPNIRIAAVCDPNAKSDDYPDGRDVNGRVRDLLGDPNWAQGARSGLCGREVGREVVRHYYARQSGGNPAGVSLGEYSDFREMLETQEDIDAVYCMTPDHSHSVVCMRAMEKGKHVITHKPIASVLNEMRLLRNKASKTDVATQMYCAADVHDTSRVAEWIAAGVIGTVREVVNVSTRPFWQQGMLDYPSDTPPVPEGFDWDLWVGPATMRPYHPSYTHALFRGWYDFGTGALGDMGHYSFYQIFKALGLASPLSIQASRSESWMVGPPHGWTRLVNRVSFPLASRIIWEFDNPQARGSTLQLSWYDGGFRPPYLEELTDEENERLHEYTLYIGNEGKILCNFHGGNPILLPKSRQVGFVEPSRTLPRPISEIAQFIRGCRGEGQPDANFISAYPFAETILLGNIALRVPRKLHWNAAAFEFTNSAEANALKFRNNRSGWEV